MTLQEFKPRGLLRHYNLAKLDLLAKQIRKFLTHTISETGGHLASNLGVVELTIALHCIFSTPDDKIIWDVGHQCYIHKWLTGRSRQFMQLRKLGGLSGFPKPSESPHDAFVTGHSSTAISAALGLASARDLLGQSHKVVAIVGDGAITSGLALEGLNNAGRANTDMLVVLNDNQMSIGKNVGAISRHLNHLRTKSSYLGAKRDMRKMLAKLPHVGDTLARGIEATKDLLKYAMLPGVIFEELGFRYFGPVDGHNITELKDVLRQVSAIRGPVLLHVLTTKGKGYSHAQLTPEKYHSVAPFNIISGKPLAQQNAKYTDIFASALCNAAEKEKNIVAVTAAMPCGTGLAKFRDKYPTRFFDVGIAEGHAVTFAAGLAKGGMRPVVAIYSSFMQRAYDNILHDVAIQNLPIVLALDRAGAVGGDGETHQGIYDYAYLAHIPNITILAPATGTELNDMLDFALQHDGPVAIRYPSETVSNMRTCQPISYGQAVQIESGTNIALVAVGTMLETALEVSKKLRKQGHNPSVYNARFVKPLDAALATKLKTYDHVFTIEDAAKLGGYGARMANECKVSHIFAFPDTFMETGTREELFTLHGLDSTSVAAKILHYLKENYHEQ